MQIYVMEDEVEWLFILCILYTILCHGGRGNAAVHFMNCICCLPSWRASRQGYSFYVFYMQLMSLMLALHDRSLYVFYIQFYANEDGAA